MQKNSFGAMTLGGLLTVLMLTLLFGCQSFKKGSVVMDNERLIFKLPKSATGKTFYVYEVHVSLKSCQQTDDCEYWSIVNDENDEGNLTRMKIEGGVLAYGQSASEMKVLIPPRELIPGTYQAMGFYSIGEKTSSRFLIEFSLDMGNLGKLVVQ